MAHKSLTRLINALALENLPSGARGGACVAYKGRSFDLGWGRVYGGQLLAQGLQAATSTVEKPDRYCHSFHSYFIRPGDVSKDITFLVDCIRDGKTMSSRRVVALQQEKEIFSLQASFVDVDESQPRVQHSDMPAVPLPDSLPTVNDCFASILHELPEFMKKIGQLPEPIFRKPVEQIHPTNPVISEPVQHVWLKSNGSLEDFPDRLHEVLLAYVSDADILPTSLLPLGKSVWNADMESATVSHSMWFHSKVSLDEWLLYALQSPIAISGRGFALGKIYDMSGNLVATAIQEGIVRERPPKSP